MTRLRGQLATVDPKNLNQIILAEGKQVKQNTNEYKHKFSTKIIAEISIFVALATVLSTIIVYVMPQGGSITAGSMVPIIWLALRRGPKIGVFAAILYGIVQLVILPYVIDPIQLLLDYPLAFGVLGFASFFQNRPLIGATIGIAGRFLMHFIAGVVYWAPVYAPALNPFTYSAVYNASYLLPELMVSGLVFYLLLKSKVLKIYL